MIHEEKWGREEFKQRTADKEVGRVARARMAKRAGHTKDTKVISEMGQLLFFLPAEFVFVYFASFVVNSLLLPFPNSKRPPNPY